MERLDEDDNDGLETPEAEACRERDDFLDYFSAGCLDLDLPLQL